MTKIVGFPMKITVDDENGDPYDISCDINSANWASPRALQDVTGLCKSAHERLVLLSDFTIKLAGAGFNAATGGSPGAHTVLKTIPSSPLARTVAIELPTGTALITVECVFSDYTMNRAADGRH